MEFCLQSYVRGYHEYGEHWIAFLEEQLTCQREVGNVTDRYAVAVKKDSSETVGHVLKKISRMRSMLLQHNFIITDTVTARWINWIIRHLQDFK